MHNLTPPRRSRINAAALAFTTTLTLAAVPALAFPVPSALASVPSMAAGTPQLTKLPISATTLPSFDRGVSASLAGATLFVANQAGGAGQLWKTDGSPAGTTLVSGLGQGFADGAIAIAGGKAYFLVANPSGGRGRLNEVALWTSDGTSSGTHKVENTDASTRPGSLQGLVVAGDKPYFLGDVPGEDTSAVYTTDGTSTTQVAGTAASSVDQLTSAGSKLFWSATGDSGSPTLRTLSIATGSVFQIEMSDGDVESPVVVSEIYAGSNGRVYLRGAPGEGASERLIVSGGSDDTTNSVAGPQGGIITSYLFDVAPTAAGVAFQYSGDEEYLLLVASGDATTIATRSKDQFQSITAFGAAVAFTANYDEDNDAEDGDVGRAVYRIADGTGTQLLGIVPPALADSEVEIGELTVSGDTLLYRLARPTPRGETSDLYRTTGPNTAMRLTAGDGTLRSFDHLTAIPGGVFLTGKDVLHGSEPWISDGTVAGTHLVRDVNIETTASSPQDVVTLGGRAVFTAEDGLHGRELWTTDGTAGGTALVKDLVTGAEGSDPKGLTKLGDRVYFVATVDVEPRLWVTDGTPEGTRMVPVTEGDEQAHDVRSLRVVGSKLYFMDRTSHNVDGLWVSDGTQAGTHEVSLRITTSETDFGVERIAAGTTQLFVQGHANSQGGLLQLRAVHANGMVERLTGDDAYTYDLRVAADRAYANRPTYGWASDGTAAGAHELVDEDDNSLEIDFNRFTTLGRGALFGSVSRDGLFRENELGVLVRVDVPDAGVGGNTAVAEAGGVTYVAGTATVGDDSVPTLWRVAPDGAVTVVRTFEHGSGNDGLLGNLRAVDGKLAFTAYDPVHGREIWTSDGTTAGTTMLFESLPGTAAHDVGLSGKVGDYDLATVYSPAAGGDDLYAYTLVPDVPVTPKPDPEPAPAPAPDAPAAPAVTIAPAPTAPKSAVRREQLKNITVRKGVRRKGSDRYVVRGRLVLRDGSKAVCTGTVEIRVSIGGKRAATFKAKPMATKKGDCAYQVRFTLKGKAVAMRGVRTMTVRFTGNAGLQPAKTAPVSLNRR